MHEAWALHARLVQPSLHRGIYQGWDLHPAQLPTRFLSTYLVFRTGLDRMGTRQHTYLDGTEGGVMDQPSTAQALAGFLLRGVHSGAVRPDEVTRLTGVDLARLTALADRRVG